ncbi:hypothetical protein KFE25_000010 [Diacronema lutheri]|uniref:NFACT RNA-binding domain-containing protein n=1 Tax=Diacronema lutheri TaxID=2081491 RepID=A0A8J5XH24_DIALT|nr:hypothetical protein KFE25_000010 [Diacronema lutheri]
MAASRRASFDQSRRAPSAGGAPPRAVDPDGLRAEAARVLSRATKRLDKARARAAACTQREAELFADPAPFDADLMALPNRAELASAEASEAAREAALRQLVEIIAELDTKAPRLPYRTYMCADGAEIRVGRTAPENDRLGCDAEHRDADNCWLHASGRPGRPGSHVVVRACQLGGAELPREVEMNVAMLAAKDSKANTGGAVGVVNICRARPPLPSLGFSITPDSERAGRSMVAVVVDRPMYASML